MDTYWKESATITGILDHLDTICPQVHPQDHCDVTLNQMRYQLEKINEKNDLITAFSRTPARLTKRNTSNFFDHNDERKNGAQALGIQNTTKTVHRQKRGWFDGVGKGAKEVFGIMDSDDAKHYDQEIQKLSLNEDYLKNLIRNQTTIQEITSNIIRRDEAKLNKVIELLQHNMQHLEGKDDVGKTHMYTSMTMQALTLMTSYTEMQNAIVNMLTMVFHGKIPPTIITRSQLKKQLDIISKNIEHHLMVPGNDQKGHISQLYTMLGAKVRVVPDRLLIRIKIPLICREYYKLYHILPVPFSMQNSLKTIVPSTAYIAINLKQDHYYMLSMEDKQNCKSYDEDLIICRQIQPLYNVQTNHTQCEMSIILDPKSAHRNCKIISIDKPQVWTALAEDNNYLFTMRQQTSISIICNANTQHCTLDGSGILTIQPQCIIKSGTLEISARNMMTSDTAPVILLPTINITDHIPTEKAIQPTPDVINWNDFQTDAAMDLLTKSIIQQQNDAQRTLLSTHDVHHYSAVYTIFVMVLVTIICTLF